MCDLLHIKSLYLVRVAYFIINPSSDPMVYYIICNMDTYLIKRYKNSGQTEKKARSQIKKAYRYSEG